MCSLGIRPAGALEASLFPWPGTGQVQLRPLASRIVEAVAPGGGAGTLAHASQGLALGGPWEGTAGQMSTPSPTPGRGLCAASSWFRPAPGPHPVLQELALGHFLGSPPASTASVWSYRVAWNSSRVRDKLASVTASSTHLLGPGYGGKEPASPLIQGFKIPGLSFFSLQTPRG